MPSVPPATVRPSARLLALAPTGRVLLLRGHDPARFEIPIWHVPGGGVEEGEDFRTAAEREFREECGVSVVAQPLNWVREAEFSWGGEPVRTDERYFYARVDDEFDPVVDGRTDSERDLLTAHGWFSVDELRAVLEPELVAPPDLADRVADLLRSGPPTAPVRLAGAVLP